MKLFAERIRSAKPEPPPLPPGFSRRVMDELERRGLLVKPARAVAIPPWLRLAAGAFLLAVGMLAVNGLVFELRENGNLELLFFGGRFVGDFLARLPYDLLLAAVVVAGMGGWLLRAGRWARVAVSWAALFAYGITGLGGLALAESGLNERVRAFAGQGGREWPLLSGFYRHRARFSLRHPNFRIGRVVAVEGGTARMQTPAGTEITVTLPPGMRPTVGDHLRMRGAQAGGRFAAEEGQFCNPRRTGRYFRHMGPGMGAGSKMHDAMGPGMGPGSKMQQSMRRGMGPGMRRGMGPARRPLAPAPGR